MSFADADAGEHKRFTRGDFVGKKLSIVAAKQWAAAKGGKCLSRSYLNSKIPLRWECSQKHRWDASFDNIRAGKWCPDCSGRRRLTIEDMHTEAKKRRGACLSTEYVTAHTPLRWKCKDGHIWEATGGSVRNRGTWCPFCSGRRNLSLSVLQEMAREMGGKLLSSTYNNNATPLHWECKNRHRWSAPAVSIRSGYWCKRCHLDDWSPKHKLSLERLQALAESRGGKCLATAYKKTGTSVLWSCSDGHTWQATASNVIKGTWCPECSAGVSERICRVFFETLFGLPFPKSRPDWLRGEKRCLELDGYCEKLKIAFEHQGEQHYSVNYIGGDSTDTLALQLQTDALKKRLCSKHGVRLFAIPQIGARTPLNSVRDVIKHFCLKYKIRLPKGFSTREVDLRRAYSPHRIKELEELAQNKGGRLLSEIFYGEDGWHQWQCAQGHEWRARAKAIRRGAWCHDCAGNKKNSLEDCHRLAREKNGLCISMTYVNARASMMWECHKGHQWQASCQLIKRGAWCPHCAGNAKGTLQVVRDWAQARGGNCLSVAYVNSSSLLQWQCNKKHKWLASFGNVKGGTWCRRCSYDSRKTAFARIRSTGYERGSIESMRLIAESRNGKCLSKTYLASTRKLDWQCSKKHCWSATPGNIKNGHWCPTCGRAKVKKHVPM